MSRIVYVNGAFVAEENAMISVFDRGFLFADSVYEVSSVLEGKLIDNEAHIKRLHRSLGELNMAVPATDDEILDVQKELIKRNNLHEGLVYLQVSRGSADRDFPFPSDAKPSLVMFTQQKTLVDSAHAKNGINIISVPDIRWKRRDIKTVGLLAQVLAKQAAKDAGAVDAWMIEDGYVTDEERPFTLDEAKNASEAFITSASTFVWPVVKIDNTQIADGKPGQLAPRLREFYIRNSLARAD